MRHVIVVNQHLAAAERAREPRLLLRRRAVVVKLEGLGGVLVEAVQMVARRDRRAAVLLPTRAREPTEFLRGPGDGAWRMEGGRTGVEASTAIMQT